MVLRGSLIGLAASAALLSLAACNEPAPGTVKDEPMRVGRTAASFPAADEDYFADMDGGYKRASDPSVTLDVNEVRGRNSWIVWTGGNDRFWDYMANNTFGAFDLLKILSSNPHIGYCRDPDGKPYENSAYSELSEADCKAKALVWYTPNRSNRFYWYGLVNEPCFEQATAPDEYGLWLDRRKKDCAPDPFENETKYPGVKIGARGTTVPVGSFYGKATGVVGLRLFPNPDFNDAAKQKWDAAIKKNPDAFYTDPDFYNNKQTSAALSRRHVVRLLSRRSGAEQSPEGSGESAMGQSEFKSRCAIFLGRPHLHLESARARNPTSSFSSSIPPSPVRSTPRSSRPTASTIRAP